MNDNSFPSQLLDIWCDDAGNNGADLLNKEQPYFAYASVACSDAEARQLIAEARSQFPVQMPELKGKLLMKSRQGRSLASSLLSQLDGRIAIAVTEKSTLHSHIVKALHFASELPMSRPYSRPVVPD